MNHVHRYSAVLAALTLAACGGGGGGGSTALPPASGGGTPAPMPTATPAPGPSASNQIVAANGGTLCVPQGSCTLTLTIPAGALSQNSTVRLGLYATGMAPKASSARRGAGTPANATVLTSFWIDLGGARLKKPLTIAQTSAFAPAAGSAIRLAKYNLTAESYFDVDTGEVKGGALVNDNAAGYVGISSGAGPSDAYEFYSASASSMAAPSAIALTLAPVSSGPYTAGGTGQFVTTGQDAHGNAYAFTPQFTIDNASVGKVRPLSTDPYTAVVTFANSIDPANLIATDPVAGVTGKLSIALTTDRPLTSGSSFAYTGTLTQNTVRLSTPAPIPSTGPTTQPTMPPSSVSMHVAQAVTVTANQSYNGVSNLYDIATSETRTTPVQSSSSTTHAYYGLKNNTNETDFLLYGTDWVDDNSDQLTYQYSTPQIIDRLPEKSGDSWTNSPATSFYENDSMDSQGSAFVSTGAIAADGSYTEKVDYPAGYVTPGSAIEADIIQNSDGSGSYLAPFFAESPYAPVWFAYSKPVGYAPGLYSYTIKGYQYPNPAPTDLPMAGWNYPIDTWFPVGQGFATETDVDNGQKPIPSGCADATFGTSGNQLVRTIEHWDTILGYHEKQTTTSYMVAGIGTVCVAMHDELDDYYNFNGDFAFQQDGASAAQMFSSTPYQTTTTDETLGLAQQGTAILAGKVRSDAAVVAGSAVLATPSNATFLRVVNHARVHHSHAFIQAIHHQKGSVH